MKLQGTEMLSRYTHSSSRTLLILAAAVVGIAAFGWNSSAWEFLGRELQPDEFRISATVVLLFLSVSTLVHFWADYTVYAKWYSTNQVAKDNFSSIGSLENNQPVIEGSLTRIRRFSGYLSSDQELFGQKPSYFEVANTRWSESDFDVFKREMSGVKEALETLQTSLNSVERDVQEVQKLLPVVGNNFVVVSWSWRILVIFLYALLPITVAMLGLALLWWPTC